MKKPTYQPKAHFCVKRKIQEIDSLTPQQIFQLWVYGPPGHYLTIGIIGEYMLERYKKLLIAHKAKKQQHILETIKKAL